MATRADEMNDSAIAIVGMAGRFPEARNVDELWEHLRDGRESVTEFADQQLRAEGVSQSLLDDPRYVKSGVALQDMEKFDPGFFGFSPLDASIMDPQHRHFLECCWEVIESWGHDPAGFEGSIGVYAGSGHNAYMPRHLLTNPELVDQAGFFLIRHTGNDKDFLATRVSYQFDLRGPSINVQTACSTSLVAVHLACQSLLAGECDMALAGGATIELPHRRGYLAREGEILSPDGHCRPFEARSNGTLFGSAVGAVALRRLDDAVADGDCILAVIRGSAINNDGSGKVGYLAPSVDGQASAIAEALEIAEVEPHTVGLLEAHGTGTAVGDPIEMAALSQAYHSDGRTGFCALGSIKANIGHTDTAAGVASLVKAVQAIRHGQIPPMVHYREPNPEIDFAASPFFVNSELMAWEHGAAPRRAGVSSLGVGGTNAHVVIEQAPARETAPASRRLQLLPVSARTAAALENATDRLGEHLRRHRDVELADAAWTLQVGRRRFEHRRVVVCDDVDGAVRAIDAREGFCGVGGEERPAVAFMFPGGGAQYPGMGRGLYETEPLYREQVDALLATLAPDAEAQLRGLLFPGRDAAAAAAVALQRPSLQLPLLFITEYALARLWMSWGVQPDALIGHSMGENTAACVSGVFEPADALALVSLRGRLFETVPQGGMLSIALDAKDVEPLLGSELCLASVNAPELCVVSGPTAALASLERTLATREVATTRIKIDIAAHSPMLDPILSNWSAFLDTLELSVPQIPFVSNLTGTWIRDDEATDPHYWVRHLRHAVRFADGVGCLLEVPERALLEVGPGRTLATLAGLQAGPQKTVLSSMRHPDDPSPDAAFLLGALGRLWIAGQTVDWRGFHGADARTRVPLPTYPWQHQRCWIEPGTSLCEEGATRAGPVRRDDPADWYYTPAWQRVPLPAREVIASPVLVFADNTPLCERALEALRATGADVVTARASDRFAHNGAECFDPGGDDFAVRPASASDLESVLEALIAESRTPRTIVHLWNAGEPPAGRLLDAYERERDRSFASLLALAQALGSQDVNDDVALHVVSRGLQQVAGEAPEAPLRALALGPVRVIGREYPNVRCRSVDIEATEPGSAAEQRAIDALMRELAVDDGEVVIAHRGGQRFTQGFQPLRLEPARATANARANAPLREAGVYLVTGGLGGLGSVLAEHLARRVRARLVLVGRNGLPPREQWSEWLDTRPSGERTSRRIRAVQAIEAAGGEVLVAAADVCDGAALRAVVEEAHARFGALHGVIHAAGVLDDSLAQSKTLEEAERVLAPKVRGTLSLAEAVADEPLDFFAVCSSVSAIAGLAGQVDYAAASAFLDAFAGYRTRRLGQPTLSIAWGPWQEVGMAAELHRSAGADAGSDLAHPLLERFLGESAKGEAYATEFSTARHWLLDEHRLAAGDALIPGTGFLELAVAALESRPEDAAVELRDVFLAAPFSLADDETRPLRLLLERDSGDFVFLSGTGDEGHQLEHVRGSIGYADAGPVPVHDLAELRARCRGEQIAYDGAPEPHHLRFGPRWACIERVRFGEGEAVAELHMPDAFAGELSALRLHPALLDMATGCAHALIPGFEPRREFCVPMSYSRVVSHSMLPQRCTAHLRYRDDDSAGSGFAVFDAVVMDAEGRELISIAEFVVKRVANGSALLASTQESARLEDVEEGEAGAAATTPMLEMLSEALRPVEGVEAFERLLQAGSLDHAIVLPHDLAGWIDHLAAPRVKSARPAGGAAVEPELLAELEATEAILAEHEAVAEAAVTVHFDRPGQPRRLGHIVWDPEGHATVSELRRFLRGRLPDDQLPQNFVELEALPRAEDGSPDRASLDDPYGIADDYVAPRSELEKALAKIWQATLRVDRAGVHDNFFDIGGHSLLAMRAIVRTEKKVGVRLNNAIMVLQTLEQVAQECEKRLANRSASPRLAASEDRSEPKAANVECGDATLSSRLLRVVRRKVASG